MEADHCFNIYDGKKALLVAAANQEEKIQWMEDIAEAAQVNVNGRVTDGRWLMVDENFYLNGIW